MTLWKYDNFCLKFITEVNNCYAIKVVFQTSVCTCAWCYLTLQNAIVNNVNNIHIAQLLITVYCKCQKILWCKLDTSEDVEVSQYVALKGFKFYQIKKYSLGSKEQCLVHLTDASYITNFHIIHMIVYAWSICFHFFFFKVCHDTVRNLDITLITSLKSCIALFLLLTLSFCFVLLWVFLF